MDWLTLGKLLLLLLLSRFSCVRLCATPETAAHQAPPSLGFSRQKHWSGLPFPSPVHKSEKWKWSRSVVSDSSRPHGLRPTRVLHPWDFPGKSTGVGCHCLLRLGKLAHAISVSCCQKLVFSHILIWQWLGSLTNHKHTSANFFYLAWWMVNYLPTLLVGPEPTKCQEYGNSWHFVRQGS